MLISRHTENVNALFPRLSKELRASQSGLKENPSIEYVESLLIPKEEAERRMLNAILGNEEGSMQMEKQCSTKSDNNSSHNSIRFTGTQEYEDY